MAAGIAAEERRLREEQRAADEHAVEGEEEPEAAPPLPPMSPSPIRLVSPHALAGLDDSMGEYF